MILEETERIKLDFSGKKYIFKIYDKRR